MISLRDLRDLVKQVDPSCRFVGGETLSAEPHVVRVSLLNAKPGKAELKCPATNDTHYRTFSGKLLGTRLWLTRNHRPTGMPVSEITFRVAFWGDVGALSKLRLLVPETDVE